MKEKTASQGFLIALMLIWVVGGAAASNVDIDYSHNVAGTGTVMTDFKMGSFDSTRATGEVHGTGEVMNRYIFQSNNTENITIQDQFIFAKAPIANETVIKSYPQMPKPQGSFRLLGTIWAGRINALMPKNNDSQSLPN